ncbi:MAG: 50S ribosomal protein L22 [Gaiellaceae bacterium]
MATAAPETPRTEVRAEALYVRIAPRKAALVADQIRGRTVPEARTILAFMTRDAARDVRKVLDSAVANAEANHGLAGDDLFVTAAFVGAGPTLKRWRARARGRVARIKKRTCHITIELALPSGEAIPAPLPQPEVPVPAAEELEPAPEEEKPKRAPRKKAEDESEKPQAEEKPASKSKPAAKPSGEAAKPARRKKEKES